MSRTKTRPRQHQHPTDARRPSTERPATSGKRPAPSAPLGPMPGYALRRRQLIAGQGSLRIVLHVLISTLIGTGVVLIGPFEHRGSVVFSVDTHDQDPTTTATYRAHLLECAWHLFSSGKQGASFAPSVSADSALGTLRLDLLTDDPGRGRAALRELTDRFAEHLRALAEAARNRPSKEEQILEDRLAQLEVALSRAARRERDARSGMPAENPALERDAARQELARRRQAFNDLQSRSMTARRELAGLQAAPLPERPPIDPADRRREALADTKFQQDRAELHVQLATVRAQLLDAWQGASPRLDDLIAAAGGLERLGQNPRSSAATGAHRLALERAAEAAADYRRRLGTFARSWTREFVALRQDEPDPAAARLLDTQERVTDLLGDFLFEASTTLAAIRDQVRGLNELSDDQARHHVLTASLTRAFHALQTAHRQFELAASAVRTDGNFRLDAAVKSARGLARRTQYHLEQMERRLQQRARQQARRARDRQIAEGKQRGAELQALERAGIQAIFEVQDRIDRVTSLADDYLSAAAAAQAIAGRADETRAQTNETRNTLTALQARRKIPVRPEAVHLISRHVDSTPSNLNRRIAYGWAAAVTAFLVLMAIQRLASTRRP